MLVLSIKYEMFVAGWDNPSRILHHGLGQPLVHPLSRAGTTPRASFVADWDNPSRTQHIEIIFAHHRILQVYTKFFELSHLIVVSDKFKPRPQHPSQTRQGIG